jgi:hypothetical protein
MANSNFQNLVKIGSRNGGNARLLDVLLRSRRMPFAVTPELVWEREISWRDFRDSGVRTQLTTITVGGTEAEDDYTVTFTTPTPDVEATYTAGGLDTNDDIAEGLAAEISSLVATSLAGIVSSAEADGAVVTIIFEPDIAAQVVTTTPPGGATLTADTTFSTVLTLNDLVAGDEFPANVVRGGLLVRVDEAFEGTVQADLVIGDGGNLDGLMEAGDVTSIGIVEDLGAAERSERFETAFAPLAALVTDEDFTALDSGRLRLWLPYCPPPAM